MKNIITTKHFNQHRGCPEPVHQHKRPRVAEGDEARVETGPGREDVTLPRQRVPEDSIRRLDRGLEVDN